jgi:Ohr subfamily peroxiredoxin
MPEQPQTRYTTEATARGGGRNGEVMSSDGLLDEQLSIPEEMGGPGGRASNPEQLFAAGYAACFHNALLRVASHAGVQASDTEVTARVGIGDVEAGGFGLAVSLTASLPGLDQDRAEELMNQAHQLCPYSRATHGNIPVELTATT